MSASSHRPNIEGCFMNSVSLQNTWLALRSPALTCGSKIRWTQMIVKDTAASQEGWDEQMQVEVTWSSVEADPQLLEIHITLAVTKLLLHTYCCAMPGPISKQFLSAVNVYKPWFFSFQSHPQRAEPLSHSVLSCWYRKTASAWPESAKQTVWCCCKSAMLCAVFLHISIFILLYEQGTDL